MTTVQSGTTPAVNSPPMAVYPLNSSSKLDQEPNPFEQSFSGATAATGSSPSSSNSSNTSQHQKESRPVLPPVAAITSPAGVMNALPKDVASQFQWDSLRSGPLSPSMLHGPARRQQQQQQQYDYNNNNNNTTSHMSHSTSNYVNQSAYNAKRKADDNSSSSQSPVQRAASSADHLQQQQSSSPEPDSKPKQQSRKKSRPKTAEDEEKRRNFLERNRIAALKCRQRKKQWLNNLQSKVEVLTTENEQLQMQVETMREEIMNLKTLLLAHKDCPAAAQNNGFNGSIPKGMPVMHQQGIQATAPSNAGAQPNAVYSQPFTAADRSQTTSAPMNAHPQQPHHFQQPPPPAMVGMPMQPPQSHSVQQQGMMAGAGGPSTGVIRL
ncbi:hypothetical protein K492DRAFT_148693 [Lichtheimia hyalospora FSU 10163]|nr:hypothetical protein K492DRAFT_148693 [Lichtheimia hyalospora FSU 10163]